VRSQHVQRSVFTREGAGMVPTGGFCRSGSAFLAHIVFAVPLTMADYWAMIDEISTAMPPALCQNLLGDPFTEPEPDPPPRGLLVLPLDGVDPAELEREIRGVAGTVPLLTVRLTPIRVRAEAIRVPGDSRG
jgi:hypothetical protein